MKCSKQLLLWAAIMSLTLPTVGFTADEDITDETPSYTNAAQAMHASNLADAAARNPDPATEAAAADLRDASQDYNSINADPNASKDDKEQAYNNLKAARENYADEIERLTGLASEDIYTMREDGMGWGQIAHELGVPPGTLGLGHTKKNRVDPTANDADDYQISDNEIAKATKRDTKQGWSKNHTNTTASTKNSQKGTGLSTDHPKNNNKGRDKNNGVSKNNNGKDQSSSSNNGKGKGKGNSKNK